MSIAAMIGKVERDGDDYVLHLTRHKAGDTTGQSRLRIANATVRPPVGADIWGGDPTVVIELGDSLQLQYRREGYTTLVEDFP